MPEALLPKFRERVEEIRERIKRRELLRGQRSAARGQVKVGGGALIERGREVAEKVTKRVQEVKPGIVPKVGEILSEWYPGKRLMTIITPKGEVIKPGEYIQATAEKVTEPVREGVHY